MVAYQIQESIIGGCPESKSILPSEVTNVFSPKHCMALRMYLKEELGGEPCLIFPTAILLPLNSRRAKEIAFALPLIHVFDELDLTLKMGRESRLYHAIDEINDAVGMIQTDKGPMIWFHR